MGQSNSGADLPGWRNDEMGPDFPVVVERCAALGADQAVRSPGYGFRWLAP
ncbi:hypothetical protein [Streptomyces sp. NPDC059176]|uniref:hypothetical protein n=1 Tax=Streptomyces sp. NPDC059176 TaxID=3346758 RepID=UPI003689CDAD